MNYQRNDAEDQEFLQDQENVQDEETVSGKMKAYLFAVWMLGDVGGILLAFCSLWFLRGRIPDFLRYILVGIGVFLERLGYQHRQWLFISRKLEEFQYKTELIKELPSTIVFSVLITVAAIVMIEKLFTR